METPAKGAILEAYPQGHIYQFFGENIALYQKAIGIPGHPGIDIAMPEGTPILAAHDGVVFAVKDKPAGFGEHLIIVADTPFFGPYISTIYGHCRNIIVAPGDRVSAGQQVAEMSNTGFVISGSTPYWGNAPAGKGVHLHFGIQLFTDPIPVTVQIAAGGKGYTILGGSDTMKGWIDPLPFFNIDTMEHIIVAGTQYLIYKPLKIAISIARPEELEKLRARGLTSQPVPAPASDLLGYWIIPGVDRGVLADIFNF